MTKFLRQQERRRVSFFSFFFFLFWKISFFFFFLFDHNNRYRAKLFPIFRVQLQKLFYFCLYYIYTLYMSLEVFQHFCQQYVSSRSQRGQPYHMAARADSRLAMRPTQSAPITPEKGREQERIHLSELTCSLEDP